MFRVKICGINDFENAVAVAHSGADAIGLNFYPQSKRCVDISTAARIANVVRGEVQLVGLFVNATAEEIKQTHQEIGLDWIQLHGDESAELAQVIKELTGVPIVAASRGKLIRWEHVPAGFQPDAHLMDAAVPGAYGGTGQLGDWDLAATWKSIPTIHHFVLAGGLVPSNVADAIQLVKPSAVDVAGGVEVEGKPGVKDLDKTEAFISAARNAFSEVNRT